MATSTISSNKRSSSSSVERTGQWVFCQDIPTDVVVEVDGGSFPLHKFVLVAKSGFLRRKILESSNQMDLTRIAVPEFPGGGGTFEKAAKFCYGVNFEINIHNVVALRCAAEYLEMTDDFCEGNLAGRTEEFLNRAALKSLSSAVIVLKSCESFLPMTEELKIVQRCVDVVSLKVCNELNFPTRSPPEWWLNELMALGPFSLQKTLAAMRSRGAAPKILAAAVSAYAEKSLPRFFLSGAAAPNSSGATTQQRGLLESIVSILPADTPFQVGFLCCLLRAAIFLDAAAAYRKDLERRISAVLEQCSVGDLLAISLDYGGERVADLDSVRRLLAGFVERESGGGLLYGGGTASCSAAMQKVAKTVDAFVGEIATDEELSVSKFAGIAGVLPKSARRFDDDLYRAVDIYLKAHPRLDEIEREKVCSVIDPLRLSYEGRLHASQNKRLPLQTVLHALYYDQLNLRSGFDDPIAPKGTAIRNQLNGDASLMKENESLRSELMKMKLFVSDLQRSGQSCSTKAPKKSFFSSVSKTFGKLNPFKVNVSKDTLNLDDRVVLDVNKPRRRRFSLS